MTHATLPLSPNDLGAAAAHHLQAIAPKLCGSWAATLDYDEEGDRYLTLSSRDGRDALMVCRVSGILSVCTHNAR